jgi:hypothetical protein
MALQRTDEHHQKCRLGVRVQLCQDWLVAIWAAEAFSPNVEVILETMIKFTEVLHTDELLRKLAS